MSPTNSDVASTSTALLCGCGWLATGAAPSRLGENAAAMRAPRPCRSWRVNSVFTAIICTTPGCGGTAPRRGPSIMPPNSRFSPMPVASLGESEEQRLEVLRPQLEPHPLVLLVDRRPGRRSCGASRITAANAGGCPGTGGAIAGAGAEAPALAEALRLPSGCAARGRRRTMRRRRRTGAGSGWPGAAGVDNRPGPAPRRRPTRAERGEEGEAGMAGPVEASNRQPTIGDARPGPVPARRCGRGTSGRG